MFILKVINDNREDWFNLGKSFNIEYDKVFPECSNWNKENLSCHIYDENKVVYEIYLHEKAFILNEQGKTLKVVNVEGIKANINSQLKE